jgi:hypothetical protein
MISSPLDGKCCLSGAVVPAASNAVMSDSLHILGLGETLMITGIDLFLFAS